MENAKMANPLRSMAAVMAADVLAIIGFIFLLLGVSKLLNEFFGIEGIGETALGAVMFITGVVILVRSKLKVRISNVAPKASGGIPIPAQTPPKQAPTDSYR